jgi:hypothetical protein
LGLFDIDSVNKRLITQSKSGCCWRQRGTWEIQDNKPVMVAEKIDVAQRPSEATPLMPKGYTDITERELKNGQWTDRHHLEGPVGEDLVMLRGTLEGNIEVELWWQVQGAVYVGEVRYPKSGSGKPIRLIGGPYDDGGVLLHELRDDGRNTGDWYLEGTPDAQGYQSGTWHGADQRVLTAQTRPTAFKIAASALQPVDSSQRDGRYFVNKPEEPKVGGLILKVLPATDGSGGEIADIRLAIHVAKDHLLQLHEQRPLLAGNLVIANDDNGEPLFRLQVVNGALQFDGFGNNYEFSSAFIKQNQ